MVASADELATRRATPRWLIATTDVVWRLLLLGLAGWLVLHALVRVRSVVLAVVVALLFTALLSPLADRLERRGLSRLAATWIVVLATIVALAATAWFVVPSIVEQLAALGDQLGEAGDRARSWLHTGPLHLSDAQIADWQDRLVGQVREHGSTLVGGALAGAVLVVEVVAGAVLATVLSFFFVKDGRRLWGWVLELFHGRARADLDESGRRAWHTLSGYILGSSINGLAEGSLKAVGLLLLGVPLVVPLALLTFFGGYVPFLGALLAGTVSASVALAAKGPFTALLVVLLSVGIQAIEGHLLQPLVMSRALNLHPVVVLLAVTIAGAVGGIVGMFVAVPAVAASVAVGTYFVRDRPASGNGP